MRGKHEIAKYLKQKMDRLKPGRKLFIDNKGGNASVTSLFKNLCDLKFDGKEGISVAKYLAIFESTINIRKSIRRSNK